ncbi:LysR family transcriptional regulator [Acetobacter persici]|uniref:LysR substrate-binding domain-containing protein n=1 Tax=Acetobacter persici TaxID=1076596 RepID=UPI0020CD1753|nr:LysR substrate-binding domain-containing protein [Acetobacter persici]MCP9319134.1 LysR family transcriptional regulator [Acetobacter persici]
MRHNLDIDIVRSFCAVVDYGSFSVAAEYIGRTQSALSMQIQKLEKITGCSLLIRNGRGVMPTAKGQRFIVYARNLLQMHDRALLDVTDQDITGEVSFGCPDDFGLFILPNVLKLYAQTHPKVRLNITCAPSPRLLELYKNNQLDMILCSYDYEKHMACLKKEKLVWVAAPDFQLSLDQPIPLVISESSGRDHEAAIRVLSQKNISYQIQYMTENTCALLGIIRSGLAMAAMVSSAVPEDLRVLTLESGLPPLPQLALSCHHASNKTGVLTDVLYACVAQTLQNLDKP